jgi:ABC-type multidrug transport system ATPase subunit
MAVPAYEVRDLRKRYSTPEVVANDGLTFSCFAGEAFGLLGANGAGKTTLVRQLIGLLRPSSGEIKLFGETLAPGQNVGGRVSYLPQGATSLGELRVAEAITSTAVLRGCGRKTAFAECEELVVALGLDGLEDRQLRKLSGGQRRLVQIGMTLAARLPVLILDEPTADIDPAKRRDIWNLISDRARGGSAVILVTHDVAEAERVLDRVAILERGRIVSMGTPAELKADLAHRTRIELVISEGSDVPVNEVVTALGPDAKVEGRRVSSWVASDDAIRLLDKVISTFGSHGLEDVRLVTPSLEDVYLEVSGRHLEEGSS